MKLVKIPSEINQPKFLIRRLPDKGFTDLTGTKHNDYEIIGIAGILNGIVWLCRCKCGKYRLMNTGYIKKIKTCKECSIKERNWGGLKKMGAALEYYRGYA